MGPYDGQRQQQQLKNWMNKYRNASQASYDASNALANFKDMRPTQKPYTFNTGETKNLVALEGTIPINYKGQTYNIPIILYLMESHPAQGPMVYVQPTATMNIKVGPHVENTGKVVVPYLQEWMQVCITHSRPPHLAGKSDISSLLQVLTIVFGESPPVFSKPKNQTQPPPNPPYPTVGQPNPPYPINAGGMPQPFQPSVGGAGLGYPSTSYPTGAASHTPPYPTTNHTSAYNPYGPGQPTPYSGPAGNFAYPQPPSYGGNMPSSYPSYPQQPTYKNPAASQVPSSSSQNTSNGYQISDEQIKLSLVSAVEDKMRRHIKDLLATHTAEMDVLRNTQGNLMDGQKKLDEFEKKLNQEMSECTTSISVLESKIPSLKAELEKRSQGETLPPEEAIDTTTPLYRQLLLSYCEEQAIEDALYVLGDSLRREVIGIEIYLKKVRDLSRRQFMLRALIQKCREKAGLSDIYS